MTPSLFDEQSQDSEELSTDERLKWDQEPNALGSADRGDGRGRVPPNIFTF